MKPKVEIWTDGSSRGNPGPGGYGAVIRFVSEGEMQPAGDFAEVSAPSQMNFFELETAEGESIESGSFAGESSEKAVNSAESPQEIELSQGFALTTNNRMELMAAIVALEALEKPSTVLIHSDSKYLVDAHEQGWIGNWIKRGWRSAGKASVKNVDLWQRLLKAEEPHEVKYVWVAGHAGNELNERCDTLAVEAACGEALLEDSGFSQN